MGDPKKRLVGAQIAASKVRDVAKTTKEKASKFEVDHVGEVVRWLDKVGKLTRQLRQQVGAAAAWSKETAAIHAELESHKAKVDSLDEALKVYQNEIAAVKGVVEEQRSRLDAAGARMAALNNHQDEARASTATYRKTFSGKE